MALIQSAMQAQGFSERSAISITRSVRVSTRLVYDAKWKIFVDWCGKQKFDPLRTTVQQLAQFLELKKGGGLAPSTLEGYRTVIAGTIRQVTGIDIYLDPAISLLLRSYRIESARTRNEIPAWDLSLVLSMLSKAPFEPIKSINMKELTFKTVFLTALATGKRRSELHALIRQGLSWSEDKSSITLRVSPEFVSKTQLGFGSGVIQPISLTSCLETRLSYVCPISRDFIAKSPCLLFRVGSRKLLSCVMSWQIVKI